MHIKGLISAVVLTVSCQNLAFSHPSLQSMGFDGQLTDHRTHWQFLGKGYRAYNPVLHRFMAQDSMSPFSRGGVNGYVFASNNPITYFDPTGHFSIGSLLPQSWGGVAGIGAATILGLGLGAAFGGVGGLPLAALLGAGLGGTGQLAGDTVMGKPAGLDVVAAAGIGAGMGFLADGAGAIGNAIATRGSASGELLSSVTAPPGLDVSIASSRSATTIHSSVVSETAAAIDVTDAGSIVEGEALSWEHIKANGQLLGSGDVGEVYGYNGRAYKLNKKQVLWNDTPSRAADVWNEMYTNLYGGRFQAFATARAMTLSEGEEVLNMPIIEGEVIAKGGAQDEMDGFDESAAAFGRMMADNHEGNFLIYEGHALPIDMGGIFSPGISEQIGQSMGTRGVRITYRNGMDGLMKDWRWLTEED